MVHFFKVSSRFLFFFPPNAFDIFLVLRRKIKVPDCRAHLTNLSLITAVAQNVTSNQSDMGEVTKVFVHRQVH